jgi:hypothetical protein
VVNEQLQPLIRIGDRVAPALRLLVCEPLGAIVTAHNGGWVAHTAGPGWQLTQLALGGAAAPAPVHLLPTRAAFPPVSGLSACAPTCFHPRMHACARV